MLPTGRRARGCHACPARAASSPAAWRGPSAPIGRPAAAAAVAAPGRRVAAWVAAASAARPACTAPAPLDVRLQRSELGRSFLPSAAASSSEAFSTGVGSGGAGGGGGDGSASSVTTLADGSTGAQVRRSHDAISRARINSRPISSAASQRGQPSTERAVIARRWATSGGHTSPPGHVAAPTLVTPPPRPSRPAPPETPCDRRCGSSGRRTCGRRDDTCPCARASPWDPTARRGCGSAGPRR